MKKVTMIIVFMVSVSLLGFDYNSYSERTIANVINEYNKNFKKMHKDKLKISNSVVPLMPNDIVKFKTKVKFTGKILKIRSLKKENIIAWDRLTSTNYAKDYNNEIEIEENNVKYLIPIQDVPLGYFKNEVKKDDVFGCYMVLMGNFAEDYLIIMTEFQTFR